MMASVASAVEEAIKTDMRVYDALRMGITNNRRLAQHIQKDVSRLTGYNTKVSTIAVTLQRIGSRIHEDEDTKYNDIFGKSRLQMLDDINILYLRGNPELKEPEECKDCFYVRIQGIGTTTLMVDDRGIESVKYKREDLLKKISNLSAIIIASPEDIVDTPGVIAQLMMSLGGNKINLIEVTSSYDNTIIIVDKKDSLKAVDVVRSLIRKTRR
ncbi:MAG: hypothetical protein GF416_07870 [Candidatus Altiarchaeales archaeon]|nr:hypothetical protein [Candidatus Altiarchaeales archaeon]MBD3417030.1 hypothetical protein [Candidatus Altiarchaeales archaeon]